MEVRMKSPPSLADRKTLMLEPVLTMVERHTDSDGRECMVFTQEFEGPALSFTRFLHMNESFDRAVLDLEGRTLGVPVSRNRNLHRLACRFTGRHRMAVIGDGQGGQVIVMAKVRTQVRQLLGARAAASGPNPPAAARGVQP